MSLPRSSGQALHDLMSAGGRDTDRFGASERQGGRRASWAANTGRIVPLGNTWTRLGPRSASDGGVRVAPASPAESQVPGCSGQLALAVIDFAHGSKPG